MTDWLDWNDVDVEKLDDIEMMAYHACPFDNIYFDCCEKLCAKCPLCPIDVVSLKRIEPATMRRIHLMFLRIRKAHG